MNSVRNLSVKIFAFLLILAVPFTMVAAEKVARTSGNPSSIEWAPSVDHAALTLTVFAPDGRVYTKEFPAGRNPSFRTADLDKDAANGSYTYELRVTPRVSNDVKRALAAARAAGDDAAIQSIYRANALGSHVSQIGSFGYQNGAFLSLDAKESGAGAPGMSSEEGQLSAAKLGKPTVNDQVIPDDLIVQGSLCVGFDCVDGESFGVDTIKLKENNLRIYFEDTSTAAGFASTDWRLYANDQPSGGANRFYLEDSTAATTPFIVNGSAPTSSLVVANNGKVGLRQASPSLDIHMTTSDTPAIRLEQTNAGGFTAQTWDVAGNEANWFVRDLAGGSKLPFRIRPGAATSSLDIAATGYVGVGTASPSQKLHAVETTDVNTIVQVENTSATSGAAAVARVKSDTAQGSFFAHASARTVSRFGQTLGGWNELSTTSTTTNAGLIVGTLNAAPLILGTGSTARVTIGATGGVTVSGNFTVTGGTKNFAMVDPADSTKAIYYAALEGPEAGTYYRGSAKTVDGEAIIELPGYFSRITEQENMTVQVTPNGRWAQIYVSAKSPEKLVIKLADVSEGDVEFDFFVQGIRRGYKDFQPERERTFPIPANEQH